MSAGMVWMGCGVKVTQRRAPGFTFTGIARIGSDAPSKNECSGEASLPN